MEKKLTYESLMRHGVLMKITVQLGTPRGRYDEHSSKLFPQKETKVCRI
jgi:hypothetical protein